MSRFTLHRTVATTFAIMAIVAAGCGDDDNKNSSSSTTTTSSGSSTTSNFSGSIRTLQQELDTLGCGSGATDGKLGPETEAAIRHFQASAGVTVDGIVGVNTRAALQQAAQSGSPNCENTPQPPTTTTTGGGSPACTQAAISSAVSAASTGDTVGEFQCSGNWAEAQVTTPGTNGFEYTALLEWTGNNWVSVDRATYCENGSVPQNIFQAACESN